MLLYDALEAAIAHEAFNQITPAFLPPGVNVVAEIWQTRTHTPSRIHHVIYFLRTEILEKVCYVLGEFAPVQSYSSCVSYAYCL